MYMIVIRFLLAVWKTRYAFLDIQMSLIGVHYEVAFELQHSAKTGDVYQSIL